MEEIVESILGVYTGHRQDTGPFSLRPLLLVRNMFLALDMVICA